MYPQKQGSAAAQGASCGHGYLQMITPCVEALKGQINLLPKAQSVCGTATLTFLSSGLLAMLPYLWHRPLGVLTDATRPLADFTTLRQGLLLGCGSLLKTRPEIQTYSQGTKFHPGHSRTALTIICVLELENRTQLSVLTVFAGLRSDVRGVTFRSPDGALKMRSL